MGRFFSPCLKCAGFLIRPLQIVEIENVLKSLMSHAIRIARNIKTGIDTYLCSSYKGVWYIIVRFVLVTRKTDSNQPGTTVFTHPFATG